MLPSYSLYPNYSATILARDLLLAIVFSAVALVFCNLAIYGQRWPRVQYISRLVLLGGFYASAILAFYYLR